MMEKGMALVAENDQISKVIFVGNILVSAMMDFEILRAVAELAAVLGLVKGLVSQPLPMSGFEIF